MGYSRDEVASELLSYYEFLIGMYLPPEALKRPPPRGWASVTKERLSFLGKTDAVVDLLRHIPYISSDGDYQIYEMCVANDFTGARFERAIARQDVICTEPQVEVRTVESHIATLALAESHTGHYIYCDTRSGEMLLHDPMGDKEHWFASAKELFAKMKQDLRELSVMALEPADVVMMQGSWRKDYEQVQAIYHKHGWPTTSYAKGSCLQEVGRLKDSWYEDHPKPCAGSSPCYSRDEIACELSSYYEFLIGMYLPSDTLKRPPSDGWPNVTKDRLSSLGKTEAVVDLLKHLPYINGDEYPLLHIYEMCICNDYRSDDFQTSTFTPEDKFPYEPPLEYGAIEPHIAVIGRFHGPNGWNIYCNTTDGKMTLVNYMDGAHHVFDCKRSLQQVEGRLQQLVRGTRTSRGCDYVHERQSTSPTSHSGRISRPRLAEQPVPQRSVLTRSKEA